MIARAVEVTHEAVERGTATVVTLDHPPTRNALSLADFELLAAAFADVSRDSAERPAYVVVRSGTPGSFCSGFRLDDAGRAALQAGTAATAHAAAMHELAACPVPVIALVDGPAVGMGCELALRCDLRIGTHRAAFAVPAGRLGLRYPPDAVAAVTAAVGVAPAAALFVAGLRVPAERALSWGLLHDLVEPTDLVATVDQTFGPLDPTSTAAAKHAISRSA